MNSQNLSKYMCQFILISLIHHNLISDKDIYTSFLMGGISATIFVYLDLYYPIVISTKDDKRESCLNSHII